MTIVEKYQKLAGYTIFTSFPRPYLFSPKDDDYTMPYVRRYFVKRINDNEIIEVNVDNYKSLSSTLYIMVLMKWKITGPQNTVIKNGIVTSEGVVEFNFAQIKEAEKSMPGMFKRLPNLLEGYEEV